MHMQEVATCMCKHSGAVKTEDWGIYRRSGQLPKGLLAVHHDKQALFASFVLPPSLGNASK